jgi:DNA mismatch endonuclease (patch repair protein)
MADVLSSEQRRLNMSRIKGKDTKPEMLIRQGLHARGLRYRLHDRSLPGRPDLVFPSARTVVFVHGCFWHFHGCALSKSPLARHEFWRQKLEGNVLRDRVAIDKLRNDGWRVLVVWECALRGRDRMAFVELLNDAEAFIRSGLSDYFELGAGSGAARY